ncbi:MAG: hypothetical protein DMD96_09825 [Candidatus Rokuibacteriota bacterium]|nr:MAG: hypothetical protein DMD96_09825 [Candidatus Rokubacteria bacterium]
MSCGPLALSLGVAAASIAMIIGAHALLFHFVGIRRRSRALVSMFAAGLVLHVVVCRGLGVDAYRTLCGALLVFCAFILYMPCYYVLATSFSVRMLLEIRRARPALSATGLRSLYPGSAVLGGRLATLTAAGYARQVGGRHVLTGKGRVVATVFRSVKRLWRLGPGG